MATDICQKAGRQSAPLIEAFPAEAPVLVAVDLQDQTAALLNWASQYADAVNAPLTIVHIVHEPAGKPGFYREFTPSGRPVEPLQMVAERMLNAELDQLCRTEPEASPLRHARIVMVRGLPKTRIAELSRKLGARLIIIGRPRRKNMGRFFVPSLTDEVIRNTSVPVAVI